MKTNKTLPATLFSFADGEAKRSRAPAGDAVRDLDGLVRCGLSITIRRSPAGLGLRVRTTGELITFPLEGP